MLEQYGGFVKLRASRNGGGLQRFCRRRMRRSCRAARRTPKSPPRTPAAAGAAPWQPPCRHLHVSSPAKYFARRREEKRRHQHQESTTASRALGAIARTEEAPLLTSMFIWERSAAPEARSHRRFKRFLDAARLRGRPGVALPVAPMRSAAACGGPTARGGGRGGGSPERGRSAAAAAVRAGPRRYSAWWPAEGVVDCGLISKNFRGLFKNYSERGEWTADCISEKFEDFYEK